MCIGIVKAMVFPVATHGYERWTVKKSVPHGTFSRIDHILGHKSSLGKFKKIEIIPVIFSDHSAVRLDLNYRKKIIKNSNIWRLKNMLLNNQQIIEEIKKEIKICIEMNENENTTTQTYGTL